MAKAAKTLPPQDPLTAGRRALHKRRNAAQDRRDALGLLGRVVVLAAAAWVLFTQVFLLTQASGNSMFPAVKDGDLLIGYRLQGTYAKNDVVLYEHDGKLRVGRVLGRDNDLIARVAQRHQRDIDRVLCAGGNDDLRRLIVQTAVLLQTVARRLAQIHQTCGRGVLGLVVLNSLDTGLLDVLRGREIRLAGTKADNILAFCLHLLEQRVDGERRRRLYTRCNSGNRFQCHCSALPYVSQEKLSFVFFIICFPL